MSGRGKLTIIIVPFRALCHEIGNSLRDAFRLDDVKVNELTDTLQIDYLEQIAELFDATGSTSKYVLALTPEKFLYLLRQTPSLVNSVGLVIYDEGHQFDTGSRGIVYELLLTEIKKLLPAGAQTILISAVIENAQAIAKWLIGENAQVVTGNDLTPTARSAAFATWAEKLGQMMFYESTPLQRPDYFVPRVIEQQKLDKLGREVKARAFPKRAAQRMYPSIWVFVLWKTAGPQSSADGRILHQTSYPVPLKSTNADSIFHLQPLIRILTNWIG